ncbi:uncharacterized protein LOC133779747 [Humulus lupulus]|uniref:uncharacterized protein LOC133779747 n=1 Tax=Humulus lupulus TaxID=3486 RepID=UPI002B40DBDF|nr:uncharacterized protein LOC133779747 [Humulus lupulus]
MESGVGERVNVLEESWLPDHDNPLVPPKGKNLLWREVLGCLPTKSQLKMKHVAIDLYYPFCNMSEETIYHSLVICSFAQEVWNSLTVDVNADGFEVFGDWFDAIFQRYYKDRMGKIATICKALWGVRNYLVWNHKGTTTDALVTSVLLFLEQRINAQDRNLDVSMESFLPGDESEHWVCHQENTVKVNVGVALFNDPMCYSYSVVSRSTNGLLVETKVVSKQGRIQPNVTPY